MKIKNESLIKNLHIESGFLCESCGKYGAEGDMEIVSVKIIKHKGCNLNVSKDYTFQAPALTPTVIETPKMVAGQENIPILPSFSSVPANQVREIVPNGIKKNDPRLLRPTVAGPNGMKVPTMADMMKEPGS